MATTTSYGSWAQHGDSRALTVEQTVAAFLEAGDPGLRGRAESSGAFASMVADYRDAINAALPDGVDLSGDEFIGPYYDRDRTWRGVLKIGEIVFGIDLETIVERYDPDGR